MLRYCKYFIVNDIKIKSVTFRVTGIKQDPF